MTLTPTPTPIPLRVAAGVVGAEALACVVAGVGFLVAAVAGKPADRPTALTLVVLLVLLGVGLAAVMRGLLRRRPAAQTPAYLTQFFTLVVAYYQRHTLVGVTIALVVAAVVALAGLSAPESRDALRRS
jgi:carbon starvation protein CstA